MWHMGDGWGWWKGFGSIWMIGLWAGIIWAVFSLRGRSTGHQAHPSEERGTALEIVERRYARGELSDEQFEAMRPA